MSIILGMAGDAGRINGGKDCIWVALCAVQTDMRASQRKLCKRMVECGWKPDSGGVTHAAVSAELTVVVVILGVAGDAGRIDGAKDCIRVALCTIQTDMCTGQRELCKRVVECSRKPAIGGMAAAATRAKLSVVGVILYMAGRTILGGRLQVRDTSGTGMAPCAGCLGMFPGQLEGNVGMVEVVTIGVNPIVARQAIISISLHVGWHEISLDLLVAGCANGLVKRCISIGVAGIASKRRAIRLELVGSESIPKSIV